jgi:Met-zincin/Domain of unknown function (DUF5117)
MKQRLITLLAMIVTVAIASEAGAADLYRGPYANRASDKKKDVKKDAGKDSKEKPFSEMTKDKVAIEGLFSFYRDTTDNSMLMSIKPDQIGPIYLCSETRSGAEGAFFDNASQTQAFPFYFKKVGKKILLMEKNLRYRADSTTALSRAVSRGISDALVASAEIKSKPQDSTNSILIDPADFFIRDAENVGYGLGQQAQLGISFDKGNSWFETIKSFPENTEIDVRLHFKTSKPVAADAMQNPYSFFHIYHYSLSTLPNTDYVPRLADDRVGHFVTVFQDYSTLDTVTPWVRLVERWNLKKKFPDSAMSEPVEPIVYWVENTVPVEYRDAVKEGIEFWNKSYEKIGFRNAIMAKQMPDTADWDPADSRYSTVRWMLQPGGTYAVGPSRTNPFTGQIYDADVRIGADFMRAMFNDVTYELKPIAFDGRLFVEANEFGDKPVSSRNCNYGASSVREAMFGLSALLANTGDLANKDSLTRQYVHEYLVELVAHEVGHTLGFRHNFKASTIHSLAELDDINITSKKGTVGTVMEYAPANIGLPGGGQGNFFSPVPGPYDDWAIEYAYSDFGAKTASEELPKLQAIASKASQPELAYGTDEDNFGNTSKAIDPTCLLWDQGDDVLAYCERKLALTRNVMKNAITKAEKPGSSYQEVLRVFSPAMSGYFLSSVYSARQIGGIYHFRDHAGDPGGRLPFKPVPAAIQKKALALLKENIFSANSFDFSPELLNKLQPNRLPDFQWTQYSVSQIDYPVHSTVLGIQNTAFSSLYSGYTLNRLMDIQERIGTTDEKFTMYDLFTELRRSIWSELSGGANINSFRRQLQMLHIQYLSTIYLSAGNLFPTDAKTLAANDLDIIEESSRTAIGGGTLDGMSRAHLNQVIKQIQAAKNARRDFARPLGSN